MFLLLPLLLPLLFLVVARGAQPLILGARSRRQAAACGKWRYEGTLPAPFATSRPETKALSTFPDFNAPFALFVFVVVRLNHQNCKFVCTGSKFKPVKFRVRNTVKTRSFPMIPPLQGRNRERCCLKSETSRSQGWGLSSATQTLTPWLHKNHSRTIAVPGKYFWIEMPGFAS